MRFTDPYYLLLLIPVCSALFWSWTYVHGIARPRKVIAFVLRSILATAIVLALAGIQLYRPNQGTCTMFVLDRSDSISGPERIRAEAFVRKAIAALGPSDQAGVVAFGRAPVLESAPGPRRTLLPVSSKIDGSASDLAAAVRLSAGTFPDGKGRRIVLLSDGNETNGDLADAAQAAGLEDTMLDFMPLGNIDSRGEAAVLSLDAPEDARADQPFDVRVTVDSTIDQAGELEIDRDGVLIKTLPAHLAAGKSTLVVSDKLAVAGLHRYRATLRAQHDRDPRNNVGMGFVAVRGKPRVLVLQAQAGSSALATSLRDAGWSVQLTGPSGIPTRAEELQAYDAILLNDINAADFVPAQMRLIQSAVRDSGIGMAMIGGENSFLPGGWYGTPVAEALPVDLNIRQRRSFPSTSILIMLDASGSMGMIEDGFQKLRLAGKAAEETVKMMSPIDRVGVAGSTDGIVLVAPMQRLDDKARVIEEIQKLAVGGGGIYVRPSMEKGEEVLMAETSKVRHFILMADGNDCDTQEGAIDVALRMRAHHITTTAIAIGDGKDVEFLKKLAAAGGGTFHLALKANQLPAIFTQDAALMSRSAIEEGAFLPKITGSDEILTGIDSMPPLLAYCIADTRPLARTSMRTRKDDPLLSVWQYGLGQSLAFTSDAQPRWARHWVGWSGFSAFWTQAVRSISRRATSNTYQVNVSSESSKGVLQVNAFDKFGNPLTATNATVRVATPEGAVHDVTLSEGAPGKYTGSFAATDLGSYIVTVAEPDGRGGQRVSASGFSIPYPAEYRTFRTDRGVLARASALANGHEISKPEQALAPVPNPGASITELWPSLMLLSAMLLPLDIAVRRLALPFAEIWSMFLAIVRIRRKTKPIAQQVTVARLQQAKERVNRETPVATPTIIQIKPREATKHEAPKPGASAAQSLLEAKRRRDS